MKVKKSSKDGVKSKMSSTTPKMQTADSIKSNRKNSKTGPGKTCKA